MSEQALGGMGLDSPIGFVGFGIGCIWRINLLNFHVGRNVHNFDVFMVIQAVLMKEVSPPHYFLNLYK